MTRRFTLLRLVLACVSLLFFGCSQEAPPERIAVQQEALNGDEQTVADCPPNTNVIEGTSGDDVLNGTSGDDCILGYDGNDEIHGAGGNDFIAGGRGDNELYGDDGNDQLNAGSGNDEIHGGGGNDLVQDYVGNNIIYGDAGQDLLIGGSGNDEIHGGADLDWIVGGGGTNALYGDGGNDEITGGAGVDTIEGGDGADLINAGGSDDTIHGGAGNDTITAGSGHDTVYGDAGDDTIAGNEGHDAISAGDGDDNVHGNDGNDLIAGGLGLDTLYGDAGNDVLSDASGVTLIDGGDGADSCSGSNCELTPVSATCATNANCGSGETCSVATGICYACISNAACRDTNSCTDNACAPTIGCTYESPMGCVPDSVVFASADTYVEDWPNNNVNHSTETVVATSGSPGRKRTLVQFDQAALLSAVGTQNIVAAHLEITVSNNHQNWDRDELIGVHRMKQPSVLSSATWNCAVDHDLNNNQDDCDWFSDEHWFMWREEMLPFVPIPTDTLPVNGATEETLSFDVTPDAIAAITGVIDNYGWMVRIEDVGEFYGGRLDAFSSEGEPTLAPRLLLTLTEGTGAGSPCFFRGYDTTCDGLDDDCDGELDEAFEAPDSHCGGDACAATGDVTCIDGEVIDACQPSAPCGPSADEVLGVAGDTFVTDRNGFRDRNFGDAVSLTVGSFPEAHTFVYVNETDLEAAVGSHTLRLATLDFTVGAMNPEWSSDNELSLHRSTRSSAEMGATRFCADDSDTTNDQTDCTGPNYWLQWGQPRPWEETATDVHPMTDGTWGTVSFDITDDVNALLENSVDNFGWALRESASYGGTIQFYSSEGDALRGPRIRLWFVDGCVATGSDNDCDGEDEDCDGDIDEGYVSTSVSCGVGACTSTANTECVEGEATHDCTAGTPASADASCNGVDNDCDGNVDEDFTSTGTTCGVGACARTGATSCTSGVPGNSCTAGSPSGTDTTCDGVDSDCDGTVDEGYVASSTTCGQGSCAQTGSTSCVSGAETNSCTAGTPGSSDQTCDGLDNDCDGSTDEGFTPSSTTCGVGACYATGTTSCTSGVPGNSCTPGTPASSDETCNGIDDDCNGTNDEDYSATSTACGQGACASTGSTSCVAGSVQNSCSAGNPAADDSVCNGVDDDCNGTVDEDFSVACSGNGVTACSGGTPSTTSCANSNLCDGAETCSAGTCQSGSPPTTDDSNPCTSDACDPALGVTHANVSLGTACGTGQVCDGSGSCITLSTPSVTGPADVEVAVGENATFVATGGGGNLQYQWFKFGQALTGATSNNLVISDVVYADDGAEYSVRVTNLLGTADSRVATLNVTDEAGPSILIDGLPSRVATGATASISGRIADDASGIATVSVTSSRLPGVSLTVGLDADGRFNAEVPLELGNNVISVRAEDAVGNEAVAAVTIEAQSTGAPLVMITTPAVGATVTTDVVAVGGLIRSSLAPEQIRVQLGTEVRFPIATATAHEYSFVIESVHLQPGANSLRVIVESPYGSTSAERTVVYTTSTSPTPPVASGAPPRISVRASSAEVYVTGEVIPVAGTVVAQRCVESVTVNGNNTSLVGSGTSAAFSAQVPFGSSDQVTVTVVAEDCDDRTATLSYLARRDSVAPVLTVASLAPSPATNTVVQVPYALSGTITELNLAGLSINDQPVGVLPVGTAGEWSFRVDMPVSRTGTTARIEVWDFAGNRVERTYVLDLDAALDMQIIAPAERAEIPLVSGTGSMETTVRVPGATSTDRVFARIDQGAEIELTLTGSVASANLAVTAGDHTLSVVMRSTGGTVLASASRAFRGVDESSLPLEVASVNPANDSVGNEGNITIDLMLTRAVTDPLQLNIRVRETVHGRVFRPRTPSADLGQIPGAGYIDVHRDREIVTGRLLLLPDNKSVMFRPDRDFEYGASVDVELLLGEDVIGRSAFQVRPMPTLAQGVVTDHLFAPMVGVPVTLREINRTAITDEYGAFSFGFGEQADRQLPGGSYTLVVNDHLQKRGLGMAERRVHVNAGRLTDLGTIPIPILHPDIPFRLLESGDNDVVLDEGRLHLNLENATLSFPDGAESGSVHVERLEVSALPFPTQQSSLLVAEWGYSLQPLGITLEGDVQISMAIPTRDRSYAYIDSYTQAAGTRVVMLGVDINLGRIVPVGVGHIDVASKRVISDGQLALSRIDAIAYGFVHPTAQTHLQRFAAGEITLAEMTEALRGETQ